MWTPHDHSLDIRHLGRELVSNVLVDPTVNLSEQLEAFFYSPGVRIQVQVELLQLGREPAVLVGQELLPPQLQPQQPHVLLLQRLALLVRVSIIVDNLSQQRLGVGQLTAHTRRLRRLTSCSAGAGGASGATARFAAV